MKLPQFTIRDLFWSTTLIAAGLAVNGIGMGLIRVQLARGTSVAGETRLAFAVLWVISGALIGAGLLRPAHRSYYGAMWGQVVFGVLFEFVKPYCW